MTTTATHNGTPYRVIYTAMGDLWAREAIKTAVTPQSIETAVMVSRIGLKATAQHYGVTSMAIAYRVRRLEKRLGFVIFPPYAYDQPTYRGRLFLGVQ